MSKKIFMIISVILTTALFCQVSSLTANAETVAEIVTPATSTSKSVNASMLFSISMKMKAGLPYNRTALKPLSIGLPKKWVNIRSA